MNIGIIGAGISGLTAAWELQKKGHSITIFEKEMNSGGIARGFKEPEWDDSVEFFYHHWFQKDKALINILQELNLSDHLTFKTPTTVMYYKGNFYPFDSIPAAILYPGLGFGLNKIRFGFVGLYLRMTKDWHDLEKVTAQEWMIKHAGEYVYKTMWEPMMIGKFGENFASKVNMAWLWARIYSRSTSLGTYSGGMQSFFDSFTQKLLEKKVRINFGESVLSVASQNDQKLIIKTAKDIYSFDKVLVTTSPENCLELVPELSENYQNKLKNLKNIGAVVLTIRLKKALSPKGYYWYNLPKQAGFPFLALVEHTNFIPSSHFNGETIVYAGDYLETDHPYFQLSQDELLNIYKPGLKKINPLFNDDWIIGCRKFETKYAQPIPFINQSQAIPDIQTSVPGLYLATMSQVYPWDRGMNFAVELAEKASELIVKA